jgi:hypothetical protein
MKKITSIALVVFLSLLGFILFGISGLFLLFVVSYNEFIRLRKYQKVNR